MRTSDLPLPDPDARAASARLARRIAGLVADAGGALRFDRFMAEALYAPGLGYYSGGARKFGAAGDFVTAPEISPLFGACVAAQCAQWFAHAPARVVEFGAGSGALAADLLAELERLGAPADEYLIVEVSGELRARQRATLAERVPALAGRVRWLDAWPQCIEGVIVANELLDAMPARVFRLRDGAVLERCVTVAARGAPGDRDGAPSGDVDDVDDEGPVPRFAWIDVPADAAFEAAVRATLAEVVADAGDDCPDDYVGEIGEQALAWVRDASQRLAHGGLLLIDYGFPRRELYHPLRAQGTLMCHYRHHAHPDPFFRPGLQDLTVHVDFSGVAQAAADAGLDLLGYASQARFLLDLGLLDRLAAAPADVGGVAHARRTQAVQVLISEAEMGELFKAIAFGRGLPGDAAGFLRGDRSHRL